jgi:hypothetical protein
MRSPSPSSARLDRSPRAASPRTTAQSADGPRPIRAESRSPTTSAGLPVEPTSSSPLPARSRRNIPENQALASALTALSGVPLRAETADRLTALGPVFARVDRQPMRGDDVRKITLTNLTRRYGHALALAEVILSARQLAPRGAELEGASIVFWMPKVWESYVASWIRGQWPDHVVEAPYRFALTNTGETAEADAVVLDGVDVIALYDAKYKWPTSAPVRLGLNDATLVYPATSGPRTVSVRNKHVHVRGINPETIGALSYAG